MFGAYFFMVHSKIDILGQKFGKLIVIECIGTNKHKCYMWKCKCDCGNEKVILGQSLRKGNTKSCGCIQKDRVNEMPLHSHRRELVPIVCGIYKITNPNGEVYIGSSRTIYRRWLRHREGNKKIRLHESIREFGWKKHIFEISHELPADISDEQLIKYEQIYIDAHKDCGIKMLNVKEAGSGGKFPEESKLKMSESRKGKPTWNKGLKGVQVAWNKKNKTINI